MKTNLLLALSLILSLFASAQRIDFYLNHMPGLSLMNATQVKLVNNDKIFVTYSAINYLSDTDNYISEMNLKGNILSTHKLLPYAQGVVIKFDVLVDGYVFFVENSSDTSYSLVVNWYDVNFNKTDSSVVFQANPHGSLKPHFTYYNGNIAFIDPYASRKPPLYIGKLNQLQHEVVWYRHDSVPYYGFVFKWLFGTNKPHLLIAYSDSTYSILFNDTFGIEKIKPIVRGLNSDIAIFNNKQYGIFPESYLADSIYDSYLISEESDTVYSFKSGNNIFYNSTHFIYASSTKLYAFGTYSNMINDSEGVDSFRIVCIDTSNTFLFEAHIPQINIKSVTVNDSIMVVMGGSFSLDGGIEIYAFGKSGLLTGLSTLNTLSLLNVYPNPVSNTLNFSGIDTEAEVQLFNTQGQLMFQTTQTQNIDVSQLPSGLYFYKVTNVKSKAEAHGKIIKL
jgi:hypothetical protein